MYLFETKTLTSKELQPLIIRNGKTVNNLPKEGTPLQLIDADTSLKTMAKLYQLSDTYPILYFDNRNQTWYECSTKIEDYHIPAELTPTEPTAPWSQADWNLLVSWFYLTKKHKESLQDPKRGLEDTSDFHTWRSIFPIVPKFFQQPLAGHFGLDRFKNDRLTVDNKPVYTIVTVKTDGYIIPMWNQNNQPLRPQVALDEDWKNYRIKAKAKNGQTISHSSYFRDDQYQFYLDDEQESPSQLQIVTNTVLKDCNGQFEINRDTPLKEQLQARGIIIPAIIDTLTLTNEKKYLYLPLGNVTNKTLVPTQAGMIPVRKNNTKEAIIFLVEGSLKGYLVAHQLKKNPDLVNYLAKEKDCYVVQLAGVNMPYLETILSLKEDYHQLQTYLALDMDLYTNRQVAKALQNISQTLTNHHIPNKCLLWSLKYKGLDDYLIQNTKEPMSFHFKNPMKLELDHLPPSKPISINGKQMTNWEDRLPQKQYEQELKEKYQGTTLQYQEKMKGLFSHLWKEHQVEEVPVP